MAPLRSVSSDLGADYVASEAPCVVHRATLVNKDASTVYLHVFDAKEVPAANAVPTATPVAVAAGSADGNDWRPNGLRLDVGCVVAASSTMDTFTPVVGASWRFFVEIG